MKPPTRYAATTMWAAISGIALLKITPMGSTSTTLPDESRVTPSGEFIHAFAATTEMLPKMPGDGDRARRPRSGPTASAGATRRCRSR